METTTTQTADEQLATYLDSKYPQTSLERVERSDDWTRCICGNEPHLNGFYCSDEDGTTRDGMYGPDAEWNGETVTCFSCGRTIDLETGIVIGRTSDAMLEGARLVVR